MQTTSNQGAPYLAQTDAPDISGITQALAQFFENRAVMSFASVTDRTARYPVPSGPSLSYMQDTGNIVFWNGAAWQVLPQLLPSSVIAQRLDSNPLNSVANGAGSGVHVSTYDDIVDVKGTDLTISSGIITAHAAGHYRFSGNVEWPVGSGVVAAWFEKNGTAVGQGRHEHVLAGHRVSSVPGGKLVLAVNDTVQLVIASLDGSVDNVFVRQFTAERVA